MSVLEGGFSRNGKIWVGLIARSVALGTVRCNAGQAGELQARAARRRRACRTMQKGRCPGFFVLGPGGPGAGLPAGSGPAGTLARASWQRPGTHRNAVWGAGHCEASGKRSDAGGPVGSGPRGCRLVRGTPGTNAVWRVPASSTPGGCAPSRRERHPGRAAAGVGHWKR